MTKLYGVIGDPIAHSLSAVMQNRALAVAKLDAVYLPFHVPSSELGVFVEATHHWPCHGFNVTIPHKQTIIPYLDEISEEAQRIGAVNTVMNQDGTLKGTNTDALGFLRSLREEGHFDPKDCSVSVLGAGGAAHAVLYGLLEAGARQIFLFNRTRAHADKLHRHFESLYPNRIDVGNWNEKAISAAFSKSQLLVNATSVGLDGSAFPSLPLKKLPTDCLVSDLIYRPRLTPLLKSAALEGLRTLNGTGMLLFQGAASFELWTGISADIRAMRSVLSDTLNSEDVT